MALTVLLVEDDRELRDTLRAALEVEGYVVRTAASAADALAQSRVAGSAGSAGLDLVLLDLGLPDGDGETLLAHWRGQRPEAAGTPAPRLAAPVLVLSARDADGGKIRLLDLGADDYLVKPISLGELLARLRVALRHRGTAVQAAVTRWAEGDLSVDLTAHQVRRDGEPLHLTPTEFRLLARLVRSAGQVVSHRQLLADVWGPEYTEHTHYLRLYMGQLRAKLERDPADPQRLLTEPGVGYRLAVGAGTDDTPGAASDDLPPTS